MHLIILTTLLSGTLAAPMVQSLNVNDDGSYQFFYETGKDGGSHKRSEVRKPDGVVVGKFSYENPNGEIREVNYRADESGYVANGDVSVEGAPKGQFPAEPEHAAEPPSVSTTHQEDPEPQAFPVEEEAKTEENNESHAEEEHKSEDIKDLPLEESTVDDPPEAFPPGFFFQKFQGLRRLPEPTKEEESTTQPPIENTKQEAPSVEGSNPVAQPNEQPQEVTNAEDPYKLGLEAAHEMELFMHLRPFQSFSPQQMDTSMFHQPVYVFSYQHPDSYGYHYFF